MVGSSKLIKAKRSGSAGRKGQAVLEYVLLLAMLVGLSIEITRGMNATFTRGFQTLAAEIEKSLVTGDVTLRAPGGGGGPGVSIHQTTWAR